MENPLIIIGIGANLPHAIYGLPRRTCGAAMAKIAEGPLKIARRSAWYASAPVIRDGTPPPADQPWYVNGAFSVETTLDAPTVLTELLEIEQFFGRERSVPDAPRTLDLDILAFGDAVIEREHLTVPHPRLHERAFALLPMVDVAPDWQHPTLRRNIADLATSLDGDQGIERQPDADGFMGTEWVA